MIAKKYRFHGYGALKFVYSKGKTVRSRSLSMRYVKNTRRVESRLAVVVSKKVTKKAPERNRMRRRIYEAVRQQWAMVEPGYDLVFTVFDQETLTLPADKLNQRVSELLAQAELLKR